VVTLPRLRRVDHRLRASSAGVPPRVTSMETMINSGPVR
jgi:hypothetical protein